MAIPDLNITEDYAALEVLTQSQLNDAMTSIETYINTDVKPNFEQIGLDVFGASYEFNNDGVQTRTNPLVDDIPFLDDNETITGAWVFSNTVAFSEDVTMQSVVNLTGQYRAKGYRATSNQAIATATITPISLNAESYDVGSMHDNVSNNERLTIPADGTGLYIFSAQATFAASATGTRELYVYKNGSVLVQTINPSPVAGDQCVLTLNFHDVGNGGDYYDARVGQDSGGSLDLVLGQGITYFSCVKVT